jgi:acetolactate synthase-1/3 small subunit
MIHTLSVLLEDKPGALVRVCQLFARRGFNIESLAVGPTEREGVSCVTLRVNCDEQPLEQIEKQMHKLVNVLRVRELEPGESVERELALTDVFNARVVDVGPETLVFEIVGETEDVDSFEELVRPHGIRELVRTGRVGLRRASRRLPRPQRVLS